MPSANAALLALPDSELLARTAESVRSASSVRLSASSGGSGRDRVEADLTVEADGGFGELGSGGQRVKLVRDGSTVYLQGDDAFYRSLSDAGGDLAATLLRGKWLRGSTTDPKIADFASMLSTRGVAEEFLGERERSGFRRVGTQTRDGLTAAVFERGPNRLYVDVTGQSPRPLESESPDGRRLRFSDWDAPVTLPIPDAADVLDLAQLERLGASTPRASGRA